MKMKAAQGMLMHHKLAKYKSVAQIVLLGNLTWLEISAQQLLVYLWKSRLSRSLVFTVGSQSPSMSKIQIRKCYTWKHFDHCICAIYIRLKF